MQATDRTRIGAEPFVAHSRTEIAHALFAEPLTHSRLVRVLVGGVDVSWRPLSALLFALLGALVVVAPGNDAS